MRALQAPVLLPVLQLGAVDLFDWKRQACRSQSRTPRLVGPPSNIDKRAGNLMIGKVVYAKRSSSLSGRFQVGALWVDGAVSTPCR